MGIEMDIRSRLVKELNGWAMAGDAKSDILAIFDDMLHAHEIIVEAFENVTIDVRSGPGDTCTIVGRAG